jgi:hypothetical protein
MPKARKNPLFFFHDNNEQPMSLVQKNGSANQLGTLTSIPRLPPGFLGFASMGLGIVVTVPRI